MKHRPFRQIRYAGEMIVIKPALALFDALSPVAGSRLASALGELAYAADTRRRNTACENIRRSGIATNEQEVRRIAKESFRHFAGVIADSLNSDRLFGSDWQRYVKMEIAPESMCLLSDSGKGLLLVSGHLGNWEIAAQFLSTLKPVVGITRRLNNPYADDLMQKRKPRHRFRLTPKHDADTGRFLAALKAGEALALLIDQHSPDKHGMMIDFFGHPASTHTSAAMLHLITKTPICFGCCIKTGPASFLFKAPPPFSIERTGNRKQDVRSILTSLTLALEEAIRCHPGQYLWAHRRWR